MPLAITGTSTSIVRTPNSQIQPFKNVEILNSLPQSAKTTVTFTITDINGGGPTDALGKLTSSLYAFHQSAPGVYTLTLTTSSRENSNLLSRLNFTTGTTPGTALFRIDVTDDQNQSASDSATNVVSAVLPANFIVSDQTTGLTRAVQGPPYNGGVAGLSNQYIVQTNNAPLTADNLNITAITPSTFIHSGSGSDAIDVSGVGGKNVLDGSTGSNFLVGSRASAGTDTFFVDDRNAPSDIWSTVSNFHAGDAATIFGITPQNATISWADNQGVSSAAGLTLHATRPGAPTASLTLAGYSSADLSNGRLGVSYGTQPDGTPYMYISGLR